MEEEKRAGLGKNHQFFLLAKSNDAQGVAALINEMTQEEAQSALLYAADQREMPWETGRLLIERGADAEGPKAQECFLGRNLLHSAALWGKTIGAAWEAHEKRGEVRS